VSRTATNNGQGFCYLDFRAATIESAAAIVEARRYTHYGVCMAGVQCPGRFIIGHHPYEYAKGCTSLRLPT